MGHGIGVNLPTYPGEKYKDTQTYFAYAKPCKARSGGFNGQISPIPRSLKRPRPYLAISTFDAFVLWSDQCIWSYTLYNDLVQAPIVVKVELEIISGLPQNRTNCMLWGASVLQFFNATRLPGQVWPTIGLTADGLLLVSSLAQTPRNVQEMGDQKIAVQPKQAQCQDVPDGNRHARSSLCHAFFFNKKTNYESTIVSTITLSEMASQPLS